MKHPDAVKSERLNVRLNPPTMKSVEAAAKRSGKSLSDWARKALVTAAINQPSSVP